MSFEHEEAKILKVEALNVEAEVYHLNLKDGHVYVAGDVLAHNKACCFLAGAKVSMADGSTKNIEDLAVGDSVICFNEELQENSTGTVVELHNPIRDHINHLTFTDGSTIHVTSDHPLYTKDGWKSLNPDLTFTNYGWTVGLLVVGDEILKIDGSYATVSSNIYEPGDVQTYSPSDVFPSKNFFVEGILAHNSCCFPAGSKVLMADYSWKNIEDVKAGDSVIGIDGLPNLVLDMDYPKIGDRTYLTFEDHSLYTSASHCLWTRNHQNREWFVSRDTNALKLEALFKKGADLLDPVWDNSELATIPYAHIDGFKSLKSIVVDADPDTQLYQVVCDRSKTYICNGFVVGSAPDDRTFDYSKIKWEDVCKSIRGNL